MFGATTDVINKSAWTIPEADAAERAAAMQSSANTLSANTLIIPDETNTAYDFYDRYVEANHNYEAAKQARDLNKNMVSYENWKKQYGRTESFQEYLDLLNKEVTRLAAARLDVLVEFNDYLKSASNRGKAESQAAYEAGIIAAQSAKEAAENKKSAAMAQSRAAKEASKELSVDLIKARTKKIQEGMEKPAADQIEATDPEGVRDTREAADMSSEAAASRNDANGYELVENPETGLLEIQKKSDPSKYILFGGALLLAYLILSRKRGK